LGNFEGAGWKKGLLNKILGPIKRSILWILVMDPGQKFLARVVAAIFGLGLENFA